MSDIHTLSMSMEIWLRHKPDPLFWPMRIDVSEEVTEVADIMLFAYGRMREIMNDAAEPYVLLVDEQYSYHIAVKSEIQALSIQAPSQESITWS